MHNFLPQLPVTEALPELARALAQGAAVLSAPPGSGKTTLVPLALLDAPWLAGRRIVMLEPRRVAARAAAARMAQLLGEPVGQTVGYQIRFERKVSAQTRIEVVTEGLLTRRLQADPELPGVGLVIFDEFHERSLDADLALALTLDARASLIPDLRVLVMSATLDSARVSKLLDEAPVVHSGGTLHPVQIHYAPPRADMPHGQAVAEVAQRALQQHDGDVLAFLPGAREIRDAQHWLEARLTDRVGVYPLYGDLSSQAQDAALQPDADGRRKVILATNIAQTSLTVEGVTTVVDGGLIRIARFDLGAGANRLDTERISKASADQRAGRAGRLSAGQCYRLWSSAQQATLAEHDAPQILTADISGFALELAAWGVRAVSDAALLDMPAAHHWQYAQTLLQDMGAIDMDQRITAHGRALVKLPLSPRRGHMLLRAQTQDQGNLAAWLVALLDERINDSSDLATLTERALRKRLEPGVQRRVRDNAQQLLRSLPRARAEDRTNELYAADLDHDAIAQIMASGYPERIARRRDSSLGAREVAYQCADGGEASLPASDALAQQPWLAIAHWQADADPRNRRAARRIRLAAALDLDAYLARAQIPWQNAVHWDAQSQTVIAEQQRRIGHIIAERKPLQNGAPEAIARALCEGVAKMGLQALPWSEAARQLQLRVNCVRHWRGSENGSENWPDLSDAALEATLEHWLLPHLHGLSRREHLSKLDLLQILTQQLDYAQQQQLARLAPTHIEVPTGSRIRVEYRAGEAPALHVKLQELFGCAQTPAVNEGRVPVVLHLLSPAQRPIAVTQDLGGFWAGSYADVRKDLRGRYPRHPWPDDPLAAAPTRRAKPRGS
ncbi:ATP-dependent helicase HrpB [Sinimarinibacterium sp. NLF-5-8]|uniref:ATP-dependent helicase HrpB n=1 Tax=Sinimarinibacterium sp. NLF-5-8 TaxID=2698684 RepID=UPI00192ED789|nr:ATP-dependent helicase HrpB [Sinimarinibacterium sp. NLF-5-8]